MPTSLAKRLEQLKEQNLPKRILLKIAQRRRDTELQKEAELKTKEDKGKRRLT
ncbi:4676_t:CDS:2 [Paraglomus occultum]|uniref:4676_t:CDS:1 n=1 Tax=Paraglomus occultum TaxID=144539 RepID=A0A9N9EZG8_9GLOM|nr:4676_t:CDS:2 [Paraglomus occultum]